MQPEDRAYLVRLTVAQTGLVQPDAERRVDEVAAQREGEYRPGAQERSTGPNGFPR
jgi:hypothetical protein